MIPHWQPEETRTAARLRAIFDNVTDGLVLLDPEGRAVEVNQAWLDIHGYASLAEVPGHDNERPWEIAMYAETGEPVPPHDWPQMDALRGLEVRNRVLRVVNLRTAREFFGSYSCTPVLGEQGEIIWLIVTIHDVTDIKRAQQQYEILLKETIESRRQLEDLTATLEEQVQTRTQQARALSRALTLAEQRERGRFARILHDDLQQILLAAKMQLDLMASGESDKTVQSEDLDTANRLIAKAVATSKSLALEMNPPILDSEGLDAALLWLASHMQTQYAVPIETGIAGRLYLKQKGMSILLVQVVRELLASAIRGVQPERLLLVAYRARTDLVVLVEAVGGDHRGETDTNPWMARANWGGLADHLQLFDGRINWERVTDNTQRVRVVLPLLDE